LEQVFHPFQLADDLIAVADVGIAILNLSADPFRRIDQALQFPGLGLVEQRRRAG